MKNGWIRKLFFLRKKISRKENTRIKKPKIMYKFEKKNFDELISAAIKKIEKKGEHEAAKKIKINLQQ